MSSEHPAAFSANRDLHAAGKTLMLLGGIRYLLPVIEAAHRLGARVVTVDNVPDNVAHRHSDRYRNISILDREAVLAAAREERIDGILSFGVDPGVVTAAFVADRLGLPTPPLASVEILQDKERFRGFLERNGFPCPKRWRPEDDDIDFPVMVKPVDSAGSKGCSRVDRKEDLAAAVERARAASHGGRVIVERFLVPKGLQTGSDAFVVDGRLVFCPFDGQRFDSTADNPYAPVAHVWPSDLPAAAQDELRRDLARLVRLLDLGTTICNVEARIVEDGKPYIMELSPRGGGNRLAELLRLATGQDLIEASVRAALGLPLPTLSEAVFDGVWVDLVLRASRAGIFRSIDVEPAFAKAHVRDLTPYVAPGDRVASFDGANKAIGSVFLRFETRAEAEDALENESAWLRVNMEEEK